jgi:acyl-CoA thioester hydrolase
MPEIYENTFVVPPEAVDWNNHVNNIEYLRWILDAAVAHSSAQGWSPEKYRETGATWVVRSHLIEYLRPAFAGETVTVCTWVAGFQPTSSPRRSVCLAGPERKLLVKAETLWVFCDRRGRPCRIPQELRDSFIVSQGPPEYR